MKRTLYGAYGSNMNLLQMAYRCPKARVIGTATLKGHKLMFRGSGVANVEVAHHKCSVPLVIWSLTPECVKALDIYEGYPRLYGRHNVDVEMADGRVESVMVYTMAERYESRPALPRDNYYYGIYDGYKQHSLDVKPLRKALERTHNELFCLRVSGQ